MNLKKLDFNDFIAKEKQSLLSKDIYYYAFQKA